MYGNFCVHEQLCSWMDRQIEWWGLLVKTLYFIQGKGNKNIKRKNNFYKDETQFLANNKKTKIFDFKKITLTLSPEVLTLLSNNFDLLCANTFLNLYYYCHSSDMTATGTLVISLVIKLRMGEIRTYLLPDNWHNTGSELHIYREFWKAHMTLYFIS